VYLRVPTWAPFRLQFYFNGYNQLAASLSKRNIPYGLMENAFVELRDFAKAQELADRLDVKRLHRWLDQVTKAFCPVIRHFPSGYHWSMMQVEFATDVVFRSQSDLRPLYETMTRTAIHAVKPKQVATFLGRKLSGAYQREVGNDFHTRIEGTRIKHHMGPVSIKMYDKLAMVLRIETTVNDVSFFKHHRRVEDRDGTWEMKEATMKKSIYSLAVLVTTALPKEVNHFEIINGVWVTHPTLAVCLAIALRTNLIQVANAKLAAIGKSERMEVLYGYLSGPEFSQRIEAIVGSFIAMKNDLDQEKRAMNKIWAKREKQIERVINNISGMYGDMQGIVGASLPQIKSLELKPTDENEAPSANQIRIKTISLSEL